jgi:hypothetical protein
VAINFYSMKQGQEPEVVALIHELIADYGTDFECKLSVEALRAGLGFLNVEVADLDGVVVGLCAWTLSFSTWRGKTGMHVCDHYVKRALAQTSIARQLLVSAARNGAKHGAEFIRTEIDISEVNTEDLFSELGFWIQPRHSLYFLEPSKFAALVR